MPLSDHSVGVWLYDSTSGSEVLIIGGEGEARVSSAIGENAATLILINQQTPVRIVGRMRGLEGNCSGFIMNTLGRDASNDRATFLGFLEDETVPRMLKFGFRDIPVLIGNATCNETGENEEQYEISFDYWQCDNFEISS